MANEHLATIPLNKIEALNRARKDYGDLDKLKGSMQSEGLIHPIAIMEPEYGAGSYLVLAGGRRLKAAHQLEWKEIDCKIFPFIADLRQRKIIELVENLIREDLTYAEEAKLIREAHFLQVDIKGQKGSDPTGTAAGHSIRDTAAMLNISPAKVHAEIKLAEAIQKDPKLADLKNKNEAISEMHKQQERILLEELASRASAKKKGLLNTGQQEILDGYILGDVLETLPKFDPKNFNFVEIDPPYAIELRNVVKTTEKQDELLKAKALTDEEKADYVTWLTDIGKAAYRVMTDNSWLIAWYAIEPWAEPTYQAFRAAGFEGTRVPAYWIKNNGNTRTPNIHLRNYTEQFMYFRKGGAMLNKPGSKSIFTFPVISDKTHPNEKPIEMYMDIMNVFTTPGSSVLSICTGSGNCLLAAANNQMPAMGIDIDEDNRQQFIAKVHRAQPGEYSSYR